MATSSVIENPTGATRKPTDLTHWAHPGNDRRLVHAACGLFVYAGQIDHVHPTCPTCAAAAADFDSLQVE